MKIESPDKQPVKWLPHNYQKSAIRFLVSRACGMLFLDPGLGKTAISLAALKLLFKRGTLRKVLIIAPLRVAYSVWPGEVEKWKDFAHLKCVVLHGPKKDELLMQDADLYIINPEGLPWLLDAEVVTMRNGRKKVGVDIRRFKKLGFDGLVIDELSKFKNTASIRYKAMKHIIGTFRVRYGLTGSPAANGLMDLFGQCYMIDEGRTFGPYITHFRKLYFDQGYDGFSYTLKPGADKEIYAKLKPMALRMGEDLIDMPRLVVNEVKIQLPDRVRKIYDKVERKMLVEIEEGTVTAKNAQVASGKCRQIANGGIFLDPEVEALVKLPKTSREWSNLHTAKVDALADLVDELQGQPLIAAYHFEHDLDRIRRKFGKSVPVMGGKGNIKASQTRKMIDDWNNGKIDLLFIHPQAGSHGLDGLQFAGNHIAWHSLTYSFDEFDQLIRRLRRQGSGFDRVYAHLFIAEGTVDEDIVAILANKERGQNALFKYLKSRVRRVL